jgi:hypothetical protein
MADQEEPNWRNSTVALFVLLENARAMNDFERAADAKRRLQELGVDVRYCGRREREGTAK